MFPFRRKPGKHQSPGLTAYEEARSRIQQICQQLAGDSASELTDLEIIEAYQDLQNRLQTNCDSAAQELFIALANISVHRPALTPELLPSPLQPLYYIGIEEPDQIRSYIHQFIDLDASSHKRLTPATRDYLQKLANAQTTLTKAFRTMLSREQIE